MKLPEDRLRNFYPGIGGPVNESVVRSSCRKQRLTKLKLTKFRFLDTSDMEAEVLRIPGQRFQCVLCLNECCRAWAILVFLSNSGPHAFVR